MQKNGFMFLVKVAAAAVGAAAVKAIFERVVTTLSPETALVVFVFGLLLIVLAEHT